ncbi:MAG: DNA-3-methyladenine glycosylase I [Fimbriimonas sp.]|nr:DNA-3-methyladenine glycosylase I [Fimbriimonas sp.]
MENSEIVRCWWPANDLAIAYHDEEWGVPVHDDRLLFELITLEGAQSGLSWDIVLRKREGYRGGFCGFDPAAVVQFKSEDVERLVLDAGIIRHRGKIESTINNARCVLEIQASQGSFSNYIWSFVDGNPIQNEWAGPGEIPAQTHLSKSISKDLLNRGFRFVGPTTVYAFMQAAGLVNDHTTDCYRYRELANV